MEFNRKQTVLDEMEEEIEDRKLSPVFVLLVTAIIIAFLADALTVYILRSFKNLQKQHQNIYIFHISVLNLMNLTFTVLSIIGINCTDKNAIVESKWWVSLPEDIVTSFVFAEFSLITIMTIDWYFFTFTPQRSAIFRKFTSTVIISAYTYVLTVTLYSIVVLIWHGYPGFLSAYLFFGNVLLSLILYLVFGTIYLRRRKRLPKASAVVLNISLIRVLLCIFLIISVLNGAIHGKIMGVRHYIAAFFLLLVIISPALQLILLYFWDRHYQAALSRIFCCRKSSQRENEENLEESMEEGAVVYSADSAEVTHQVV